MFRVLVTVVPPPNLIRTNSLVVSNACKRVPRPHMFIDSPELYDAIYHFKSYARECDRLRSLINEVVPSARMTSMLRAASATQFFSRIA